MSLRSGGDVIDESKHPSLAKGIGEGGGGGRGGAG